jgi:PAS domain S-box-containing protein
MSSNAATLDILNRDIVDYTIENHPVPLIITAGEAHEEYDRNHILYANRAFEKMTGYSKEELFGETPKILQGPETSETLREYMSEELEAGEHLVAETINYGKDDDEYAVRMAIDPIETEDGITNWVSIYQDVSSEAFSDGFRTE